MSYCIWNLFTCPGSISTWSAQQKSRVAQTKSPIILPKVICHFAVELLLLLLLFLYIQCKTSRKKKQIPLIEIVGDKFLHSMVAELTLWIYMYLYEYKKCSVSHGQKNVAEWVHSEFMWNDETGSKYFNNLRCIKLKIRKRA